MITIGIELKGFLKVSTNTIYKGIHWTKRKQIKDDYLVWFLSYLKSFVTHDIKVNISFDYYWKTKALDSDNCSYMSKMIVDCLVHYDKLKDDTINYVGFVSNESHRSDRDYDYVVIKTYVVH